MAGDRGEMMEVLTRLSNPAGEEILFPGCAGTIRDYVKNWGERSEVTWLGFVSQSIVHLRLLGAVLKISNSES